MHDVNRKAMWARKKFGNLKMNGQLYGNPKVFEQDKLLKNYENLPKGDWKNPSSMSVKDGLKHAQHDIRWYAHLIDDPKKKVLFAREATKMVNDSAKKAKTGFDVSRGVSVEAIYYKYKHNDKDGSKHGAYLRSLD